MASGPTMMSDWLTGEEAIKDIEADVPARGAPGNKAAIDAVPERQAGAAAKGLEFPPDIAVLKHPGSVGSRDTCFGNLRCSHPGEIHRGSSRIQARIGYKWRPLAEMRRVGQAPARLFPASGAAL